MCEFSVKPVKDDQNRGWKGLAPLVPPYNCLRKYHEQLVSANIMNNPYAVTEIQKAIGLRGIEFRDKVVLLKEQVADFFEVTPRTVENYLAAHEAELRANGYEILRGNALQELRLAIREQFGPEIDFGTKTTVLGILDFRAFLNIGMLIAESERARVLRQAILDIAIDAINRRTGGGTKYINQRDEDFIHAYFQEENYRKEFTDAFFLLINLDFRAN